jgi:hypothetical protein
MAEIINLNKRRKAKKKVEKEKKAAENRVKFGRTKQEKKAVKHENERRQSLLDGHKIEKRGEEES